MEVYEINGPFFFGAADKFKDTIQIVRKSARALILKMHNVPVMDATGIRALEDVFIKAKRQGMTLILCGVNAQPLKVLKQSGLTEKITSFNICESFEDAIARAKDILSDSPK